MSEKEKKIIRDGVIPRLDVTKAAKLMGMNHNTVRNWMQDITISQSTMIF